MMQTHNNPVPHSPAATGGKRPRFLRKALGLLALSAAAFWGTACSSDELDALSGAGSGGAASRVPSYVSLRIATPSATPAVKRDNPTGGEEGDGREEGRQEENEISSIIAFFYPASISLPTANQTAGFSGIARFSSEQIHRDESETGVVYFTDAVDVDGLEPGSYKVLLVANATDMDNLGTNPRIFNIQDRYTSQAWSGDEMPYSHFVMTSTDEVEVDITDEYNKSQEEAAEHPVRIDVERLAARVDYKVDTEYTTSDAEEEDPLYGTITITGLALANNLSRGEYLFKRVTQGTDLNAGAFFFEDETATTMGAATNYVLDPWTLDKTVGNADLGQESFKLGGDMASRVNAEGLYLSGHYFPTQCADNQAYWSAHAIEGLEGKDGYRIAGYTMENTLLAESPLENYATAAIFKARFEPENLDGYVPGQTFFRYNDRLYSSLEQLRNQLWGSDFYASFEASLQACADWEAAAPVAAGLPSGDPFGYKSWLQDKVTKAEGTFQASGLTWAVYMEETYGYVRQTDGTILLDQDKETNTTQVALAEKGIRTYRNSECYYTYFIKHANDGNDANDGVDAKTHGVMEYGIVRNNIYKLYVEDVAGLGGDVPDPDYQLRVHVSVNKWVYLEPETLPM
ncbi:MAG: Mfa1 family fimbria major subunit [Bacteroidaceae bacterium]|jgi:hypothetical protein